MISRKEKRFRRKIKKKVRPHYEKVLAVVLIPFMPLILRFKKMRRFAKGMKFLKSFGKIFMKVANLSITGYELYNNFIKDFLEKRKKVTSA